MDANYTKKSVRERETLSRGGNYKKMKCIKKIKKIKQPKYLLGASINISLGNRKKTAIYDDCKIKLKKNCTFIEEEKRTYL